MRLSTDSELYKENTCVLQLPQTFNNKLTKAQGRAVGRIRPTLGLVRVNKKKFINFIKESRNTFFIHFIKESTFSQD